MKSPLGILCSLIVAASSMSGCAPGLGTTIPVTRFPDPASVLRSTGEHGRVLVKPFTDGRTDQTMVLINSRPVDADSDVANAVRSMTETYLKAAGYAPGTLGVPSVSGVIERWSAEVFPGFPSSRADATAALTLSIAGPDGSERFKGTYRGSFSVEHPIIDEEKIAGALGEAMAAALQEAMTDPRFTVLLEGG